MKLQKEAVGASGLDANSLKKYERLSVKIADGNLIEREQITYDDGKTGTRTRIPVYHEGEPTSISFGKLNINKLIDALGDETETWTGAEIDLIVIEYPSLGKQGFDIEAIRAPKKEAAKTPEKPRDVALRLIRGMDAGKGAPTKAVLTALQAETGISPDAADAVIQGLKNEGAILENRVGYKVV